MTAANDTGDEGEVRGKRQQAAIGRYKKLERRVKSQEKKIAEQSGRFPIISDNEEQ